MVAKPKYIIKKFDVDHRLIDELRFEKPESMNDFLKSNHTYWNKYNFETLVVYVDDLKVGEICTIDANKLASVAIISHQNDDIKLITASVPEAIRMAERGDLKKEA